MMHFEEIERRSVAVLHRMELAKVPLDAPEIPAMLDEMRNLYTSARITLAQQNGNYRVPDFQEWSSDELHQVEQDLLNGSVKYLQRLRIQYSRLEQILGLLTLNQTLGLGDSLSTRYCISESFPRFACGGPVAFNMFTHQMKSLVVAPPKKKLYLAGYDILEAYVLAELSGDCIYGEALQTMFASFGEQYFPEIPQEKRYKLLRCLAVQHSSFDEKRTNVLFDYITDEEGLPRIDPQRAQNILRDFQTNFLIATGYLEELKQRGNSLTHSGRILRGLDSVRTLLYTACDISKTGIANILEDDRLKSMGMQPHLIFYDDLLFSVDEDADEEYVHRYIEEDLGEEAFPGLSIYCLSGDNWKDAIEKRRRLAGF